MLDSKENHFKGANLVETPLHLGHLVNALIQSD